MPNSDPNLCKTIQPGSGVTFLHPAFGSDLEWAQHVHEKFSASGSGKVPKCIRTTICDVTSKQSRGKWRATTPSRLVGLLEWQNPQEPDLTSPCAHYNLLDAVNASLDANGGELSLFDGDMCAPTGRIRLRRARKETIRDLVNIPTESEFKLDGSEDFGNADERLPSPLTVLGKMDWIISTDLLPGVTSERETDCGNVVVSIKRNKSVVVSLCDLLDMGVLRGNETEQFVFHCPREGRVPKPSAPEVVSGKPVSQKQPVEAKKANQSPSQLKGLEEHKGHNDLMEACDMSSYLLDPFRDMRKKDNTSVKESDDTEDMVYIEGGSTIEQALSIEKSPREVLTGEKITVRHLLMKGSQYTSHRTSIEKKSELQGDEHRIKVVLAGNDILREILECKSVGPCSILGLACKPQNVNLVDMLKNNEHLNLKAAFPRRVLFLDGLTNSENVGSLIRSASCFGVQAIVLSADCCTCWSRRAVRVAMGHCFRLPIYQIGSGPSSPLKETQNFFNLYREKLAVKSFSAVVQDENVFLHQVRREHLGINVRGKSGSNVDVLTHEKVLKDAEVCPINEMLQNLESSPEPSSEPSFILAMGAEHDGVTKEVRELSDYRLKIRMAENCDSFNVGVAASIILNQFSSLGFTD